MRVLFITSQWPTLENPHFSPFVKDEVDSFRSIGLEVNVFNYKGGWSIKNYLKSFQNYKNSQYQYETDVVFCRFGQSGLFGLIQNDLPFVVQYGGSDLIGWKNFLNLPTLKSSILTFISRYAARKATFVIVPNNSMKKYLTNDYIHVIPTGVNLKKFYPIPKKMAREKLGFSLTKKLILFPSNPDRAIKNFSLAQKIFEKVKNSLEVGLVVTKNVPHDLMIYYYNACDVMLLTSIHEGSPNVIKEALACNLPFVSSNVGDLLERYGGDDYCKICLTREIGEYVQGIKKILDLPKPDHLRLKVVDLDSDKIARQIRDLLYQV